MISRRTGTIAAIAAIFVAVVVASSGMSDPVPRGAALIATAYLLLALTEIVPPFVPTLLLWVATPCWLGSLEPRFSLAAVLTWPADPVLALFAGGLSLCLCAQRHGIDAAIASSVVRVSRGERRALLALVLLGTAILSMWMSNIAAAAMVLAALRPIAAQDGEPVSFRRALLVAVAMGANLGGMGTPIGSGPNALAIAAAEPRFRITFVHWMGFALPLVLGMLVLVLLLLIAGYRVQGRFTFVPVAAAPITGRSIGVVVVFCATVLGWLSEPLHGVSAPLVGLASTLVLFGTGLLQRADLGRFDWSTLGLIAGGISLGKLIERSGLLAGVAALDWHTWPQLAWMGGLLLTSALLSAVMSNTGTAALLIPLGMSVAPAPSTAVLIAIAASLGVPFTISTPPNAMAYGEGGLRSSDLLRIGIVVMLSGCALVALTGVSVLRALSVP